jgi:hypothetical protein
MATGLVKLSRFQARFALRRGRSLNSRWLNLRDCCWRSVQKLVRPLLQRRKLELCRLAATGIQKLPDLGVTSYETKRLMPIKINLDGLFHSILTPKLGRH